MLASGGATGTAGSSMRQLWGKQRKRRRQRCALIKANHPVPVPMEDNTLLRLPVLYPKH
jgi:hypothetical protein